MFGTCGHWWEGVKSWCVCHEWYHHRSPTGTGLFRIAPVFIWCWKEDPYLLWEWDQSTASERWWRGNHQLRRYQPHTTPEEHSESPTPELARDPDCRVTANDEAIPICLLNLSTEEVTLYGRSCVQCAKDRLLSSSNHHFAESHQAIRKLKGPVLKYKICGRRI